MDARPLPRTALGDSEADVCLGQHFDVPGQYHRPLDDVSELADVARPVVRQERLRRPRAQHRRRLPFWDDHLQEMQRQRQDLVRALTQERNPDGNDVDPVV